MIPIPPPLVWSPPPTFGAIRPARSKAEHRQRAHVFRAEHRRGLMLRQASDIVPHLPALGESLHTVMSGEREGRPCCYDFACVVACVLRSRPARCERLRNVTLTFSAANVQEVARWLDSGKVASAAIVCSDFHRKANTGIYAQAVAELVRERKQIVTSARTHAKIVLLDFADGLKIAMESSANLRSHRTDEQLTIINDPGIHDWHAGWIDRLVAAGLAAEGEG